MKSRPNKRGSDFWHFAQRSLFRGVVLCALLTLSPAPVYSQILPSGEIDPIRLRLAEKKLAGLLAPSNEEAFLQVFVEVSIDRDALIDTAVVYDLIVHYDPNRYVNPRVGSYPLRFEEQLILWGKRIASYTKSTQWTSGRFYLRDLSTGRAACIFTTDARRLYAPSKKRISARDETPYTDIHTTGQWLRAFKEESREAVGLRL
ncbi:MAG: hypothetical protein VXW00_12420, partial [Candidatus Latescibacterota bacterium]|nr:hypothetical protein [Candidatus Latescibacterota bacterium]